MNSKELPSLWQLRVFETVARHQSVTRASHELLRSQPATTSCVAGLEESLGTSLFERSTTGIYLTPVGSTVLVRAQKILAGVEGAIALLSPTRSLPHAALASRITRTQMRCMIAVAETKSFRAAARKLAISEASLQRAARSLEENLGAELFRNTANGTTATEAGEEFARRLQQVAGQIEALAEAVDAYDFPPERSVRVGVLLLDPTILIVNAIRDTTTRYPESRVVVISGTYEALVNKLMREDIDFIIGILKAPDPALGFVEESLYPERYCVAARRDHPLARSGGVTTRELRTYPWILPPKGSPRRHAYEHLFSDGAPPPANIETYSLSTIRFALCDSDMLTVLSWTEMQTEQRFGLLAPLLDVAWTEPVVGITRPRDWKPNAAQEEFLASLSRHAATIGAQAG